VRGRGFLPVTTGTSVSLENADVPFRLATTGSFRTDSQGYLRTSTDMMLLGWPADSDGTVPTFPRDTADGLEPIRINVNQFAGEPTTRMNLGVNLPATDTEAGAAGDVLELSVEYFDNLGTSQNLNVTYTPTVPATGSSNEWTMVLQDSANGGGIVGEYTMQFDDTRGSGGTLASVTTVSGGAYDPATGSFQVTLDGGPLDVTIGEIGSGQGVTRSGHVRHWHYTHHFPNPAC